MCDIIRKVNSLSDQEKLDSLSALIPDSLLEAYREKTIEAQRIEIESKNFREYKSNLVSKATEALEQDLELQNLLTDSGMADALI